MGDLEITKDTLTDGINKLDQTMLDIVFKVFQYWKTRAVSDMRTNARWIDRTGNARNGLNGAIFDDPTSVTMVLYHSMPYGIFLEVRWSGRYAIIGPTMADVAPKLAAMIAQAIQDYRGT